MNATQDKTEASPNPWWLIAAVIGLIFLIPRLPVRAHKNLDVTSLPQVETPYLFVTFGFAGCGTICPGQLQRLQDVVDGANQSGPVASAVFINMNATEEKVVAGYVGAISEDVIALRPSPAELQNLLDEFGVRYYGDTDSTDAMEHRGDVYLLARSADRWRLIESFPGDTLNTTRALAAVKAPPLRS
ncbi:MAG: SCO family protein [Planctomycetota bacterium]|nr:SCO family protein [Planctomycetota bacterium]